MVNNPTYSEWRESRANSFATCRWVAENYRIDNGRVVPLMKGKPADYLSLSRAHASEYMPLARPELPGKFAKIAGGSDNQILEFVRQYGLLGYAQAYRSSEIHEWKIPRGALAQKLKNDGTSTRATLEGDPVPWILAHAATVNLVMELSAAIDDASQLDLRVQKLLVSQPSQPGSEIISFPMAIRGEMIPVQAKWRKSKDLRENALDIILAILNHNLEGITRALAIDYDEKKRRKLLTSVFVPQNLLDCIYWHLANAVIGSQVRTCAYSKCGRFFIATHQTMKYCPPSIGQKSVSRCMDAAKHQPKAPRAKIARTPRRR